MACKLHLQKNMTINKQILRLAIPNIISNLSVPMLSVVDTALMGHLPNSWSIGAVAVGSMIFNFVYWGFGFLRMGTTGLTAQARGKEDDRESSMILTRALLVAVSAALFLFAFQYFIAEISFSLIHASDKVEYFAKSYFYIRILAAPATLALYALTGWFLGMQNARFPMYVTIFVNSVNIAFDAWFVLGLDMGSDGAAWGTVIAQYAGLLLALYFLKRYFPEYIRRFSAAQILHKKELICFFKLNGDIFIRTLCLIFTFSFFTAQSASLGDKILAVNSILIQLWSVFSYGIDGFAYAAESLTGRFLGAQNIKMIRKTVRLTFLWGTGLSAIFSLTFLLFGREIISLFTNQTSIISTTVRYLGWTIAAPLINSFSYIWDGIYIGAAASKAMRNSMLLALFLFFLPVYYVSVPYLGNDGMWLAMLLFMAIRGISLTLLAKKYIFTFQDKTLE